MARGEGTMRGEELSHYYNLPQMLLMLLVNFHYNFPLGPLQTILLFFHPQDTTPICLFLEVPIGRRQQNQKPAYAVWPFCSGWEGRGIAPGRWKFYPLEFGSESMELSTDVDFGHNIVWADADHGTHKCRFTKATEKGLGQNAENICSLNTGMII